ncbi:uncharacterized protein LOC111326501 [Stylophora pistillata]|uniref:uncharacterized protein LOC111326501 n=1 Tax=Stylophora pistillata TaxID=50429 RepID=UPI000C03995D|nr:uncharacterized protein LOC111326501 [Stylophora pistillata]
MGSRWTSRHGPMPKYNSKYLRYLRAEGKKSRDIPVSRNSGAPKAARIHSAIAKGKQTLLPCEGENLSKFEHNGRKKKKKIYAEEAVYNYSKFGRFKVIMALKPVDSLRNQLFFAKESTKHNKEVLINNVSSHVPAKQAPNSKGTRTDGRFLDRKEEKKKKKRRTHLKPSSRSNADSKKKKKERYKTRRATYDDLMGKKKKKILDKLDNLYRQRKEEKKKKKKEFSNLGEIRTELNTSTGLRGSGVDLEDVRKEPKETLKLPKIRVSTVSELSKKDSRRKLDRKHLLVPREKVGGITLGARNANLESVTFRLPEL